MKLWTQNPVPTTLKAVPTMLSIFCLSIFLLGLPSMVVADLPDGIIAMSDDKLTLSEAEEFCRQQGGRLPFVGNTDFLEGYSTDSEVAIDGFAHIGAPWPEALPDDFFWSGTKGAKDNPDLVYLLSSGAGLVRADIFYDIDYKDLTAYAACVSCER